jgi:hypothetical protein
MKMGASGFGGVGDSLHANSSLSQGQSQVPGYIKQLPAFKAPYQHLIEMFNKKTCKRRIIACESATTADQ